MAGFVKTYLPDEAGDRLRRYVYRGSDKSLLYKFLWRPLCVRLVQFLPVWLSANVITVTALLLVCVTHGLIAYYMPYLSVDSVDVMYAYDVNRTGAFRHGAANPFSPPPYIFLLAAAALFLYVLLDNLDGHQARRTRMASPLGLIMDHGCDAFNCVIGSLSVASAASTGPTWKTWLFLLSTVTVFVMNTWEEYYLGELILPVINGANEGVLLGIVVYLLTAYMGGPEWWSANGMTVPTDWVPSVLAQRPPSAAAAVEKAFLRVICPLTGGYVPRWRETDASMGLSVFLFGLNCSAGYVANPTEPTRAPKGGDWYVGNSPLQNAVLRLYDREDTSQLRIRYNTLATAFITIGSLVTCLGNVVRVYRAVHAPEAYCPRESSWPFLHALTRLLPLLALTLFASLWFCTSPNDIFSRHPRLFCWTVGLLYTKSAVHLMIAHVCHVPFLPLRRTMWPFLFLGMHMLLTYYRNIRRWARQTENTEVSAWLLSPSSVWDDLLDETLVLWGFFMISVLAFVHLAYSVVREIAVALNVPVFTIPHTKQEELRKEIDEAKHRTKKS